MSAIAVSKPNLGRGRSLRSFKKMDRAPLSKLLEILGINHKRYDLKVKEQLEWAIKDSLAAYKRLIAVHHPDRGGDPETALHLNQTIGRIKAIGQASGVIMFTPFAAEEPQRLVPAKVPCGYCGKPFEPRNAAAKYCRRRCMEQAIYSDRRREQGLVWSGWSI